VSANSVGQYSTKISADSVGTRYRSSIGGDIGRVSADSVRQYRDFDRMSVDSVGLDLGRVSADSVGQYSPDKCRPGCRSSIGRVSADSVGQYSTEILAESWPVVSDNTEPRFRPSVIR